MREKRGWEGDLGTGDPTEFCWACALLLTAGIRCQHSRRLKKGLDVP